ncbi:carboxymuconolactone decarboxylase family protein [soil metagenome]
MTDSPPPRQPRLLPGSLDGDQAALYDAITQGPRSKGPQLFALTDGDGALVGPFGGFLLSPLLGEALQQVGAAVRYRSALSDRVRELAILVVAAHWHSPFETMAHEAVGRACGLTKDEMAAIRLGGVTGLHDPAEAAAVRLVRAMLGGDVDDETWAACVPPLEPATVFELTTLVGYYSTLALQMRVLRVESL